MGGVWFPDVPVSRSQQPSTGQVESMQERFDVVVHFCPAKLWVEVVWFPARVCHMRRNIKNKNKCHYIIYFA